MSKTENLILAPIFAAREKDTLGVSSENISETADAGKICREENVYGGGGVYPCKLAAPVHNGAECEPQ